jgi:hypothetical protein
LCHNVSAPAIIIGEKCSDMMVTSLSRTDSAYGFKSNCALGAHENIAI